MLTMTTMSRSPSTRSPSPLDDSMHERCDSDAAEDILDQRHRPQLHPNPKQPLRLEQLHEQDASQQRANNQPARCNPFSIDYILSNAAKQQQHQDGQAPAAAAAPAPPPSVSRLKLHGDAPATPLQMEPNFYHSHNSAASAQMRQPQIQLAGEGHKRAPPTSLAPAPPFQSTTHATNPNFFYFMACMLLQQQQHQQQHHQQQQQALARHQQQQQHQLAALGPPPPPPPPPRAQFQATPTPPSPIDSLALLARLTGGAAGEFRRSSGGAPGPQRHSLAGPHAGRPRAQPYSPAGPPPPSQPQLAPGSHLFGHLAHLGALNQHLNAATQANLANFALQQLQSGANAATKLQNQQASPRTVALKSSICKQFQQQHQQHQHQHQHQQPPPAPHKSAGMQSPCAHPARPQAPGSQQQAHHQSNGARPAGPPGPPEAACLSLTTPAPAPLAPPPAPPASCGGADKLDNLKPAHSYIGLIGMCILSSADKRMVLNDIYQYILDHYPYYRNRGSGWRNSVRHNLSLNECFQKAGRAANGKGHYWTIHPANMEDFMNGDFRRRRAQRKVRRWNNMDVPSDESDDESVEDAGRPPLPDHFKRSIAMHKQLEASELAARSQLNCQLAHHHQQQHQHPQQQQHQQQQQQQQATKDEFMARVAAIAAAAQQTGGPAGARPSAGCVGGEGVNLCQLRAAGCQPFCVSSSQSQSQSHESGL